MLGQVGPKAFVRVDWGVWGDGEIDAEHFNSRSERSCDGGLFERTLGAQCSVAVDAFAYLLPPARVDADWIMGRHCVFLGKLCCRCGSQLTSEFAQQIWRWFFVDSSRLSVILKAASDDATRKPGAQCREPKAGSDSQGTRRGRKPNAESQQPRSVTFKLALRVMLRTSRGFFFCFLSVPRRMSFGDRVTGLEPS